MKTSEKLESLVVTYADLALQIRECNSTIRRTKCTEEAAPDYQNGDKGAPSCLTEFFNQVSEERTSGAEGKSFEAARDSVLADIFMCDVCRWKLGAIERRKELKVKAAGVLRSIVALGSRIAQEKAKTT